MAVKGLDAAAIEADQNDRTTAVGLFHFGLSYRAAADKLAATKIDATHPAAPRNFLYYHAVELLLKSFLRNSGVSVRELKTLSHSTGKLAEAFEKHGGVLMDEDRDVLGIMEKTDCVTRSRYIVVGAFTEPTAEALARTVKSLSETVQKALKGTGQPVR